MLGEERLREELCGLKLEMSHGAFFQTNTEMAERLYAVAAEFAGLTGSERVFDLFCGIGTIGLTMASQAGEVWGLEIVPEAIADAERNARRNKIENAHFVAANARTGVRPLVEKAGKPDVVVVDPPRAGLSQKIVRRVLECEAQKIVYVSCNPTTLAPNAAQLAEAGYRLRRVRPVDMFPQTPHIECVALFERKPPGATPPETPPDVARIRSRGGARPGGGAAAGGALRRARLRLDVVERPPRGERPGDAGRVRRRRAGARARRRRDRPRPHPARADRRRRRARSASTRSKLWLGVGAGFSKKPLTAMREALPRLREALPGVRLVLAAMGPKMCALAGSSYDGAFFNWMTPELRRRRPRQGRGGRRRGRPRHPARSSATSAPPSAPTPPSASPRRSPSTATSTTATATTSTASPSPRAPSASPPPTASAAQQQLAAYGALDTLVVRGLATAKVESMTAVAEAAAPRS